MPKKLMKEKLNEESENLKLSRTKREKIRERGITLIALVVTIIILLILAGVTLNIALSDGGLFEKAKGGSEKYKQAQTNEEGLITDIEKEMDKYGSGNPSTVSPTPTEGTPTTIQDAKSKDYTFENTTTVTDGNGNKVVIPGKFHIASDSGITVQEGIVIEDSDGNQFVWIPVSNVNGGTDQNGANNEDNLITVEEGKTVEITLGRYTFAGSSEQTPGTPTLKQKGSDCGEDDANFVIDEYYKENTKVNGDNAKAKNLEAFVDSVNKNHGYYIARYEASFGSGSTEGDYKPLVQVSKSYDISMMDEDSNALWNFITQPVASKVSQNMYELGEDDEAKYVESDLVNSYAWDTAIVYIREMKEDNKNYANATSPNSSLENTGETGDEKCHIFDMAGNLIEWTTEYSTYTNVNVGVNFSCVFRGGSFQYSNWFTAYREDQKSTYEERYHRVPSTYVFEVALCVRRDVYKKNRNWL